MEGAILHPDEGLPAVLQEGDLQDHRHGRLHLQGTVVSAFCSVSFTFFMILNTGTDKKGYFRGRN